MKMCRRPCSCTILHQPSRPRQLEEERTLAWFGHADASQNFHCFVCGESGKKGGSDSCGKAFRATGKDPVSLGFAWPLAACDGWLPIIVGRTKTDNLVLVLSRPIIAKNNQ